MIPLCPPCASERRLPFSAGVAIASANEVSFSTISLVSGLLSNVCFALRAISAKKLMTVPVGQNMNAQNLYAVLTLQALVGILPLALLAEGGSIVAGTKATIDAVGGAKFLRMLLIAGVSHYTYNECAPSHPHGPPTKAHPIPLDGLRPPPRPSTAPDNLHCVGRCAFLALSSVHPVTHAVANTIKCATPAASWADTLSPRRPLAARRVRLRVGCPHGGAGASLSSSCR